jgi:transglutaminase-like putative cysteine protease
MPSSARNHAHILLTFAFFCVSISLFEPVMSWILIIVICAVVMRIALYLQLQKHAPSIRTLNLLALLSAIVLAYFSFQLGVLLGMLNLLVLACALKLMLLRNTKDYYQLITSCGFLIGCGFIFQQGIGFSIVYLALTMLLVLSLASFNSPALALQHITKNVTLMCLQAIPIGLLLFLVMPQINPLWQMPTSKTQQTGLAEQVTPGDIANLSQSADLAFRVTFDSRIPTPSERYWRALVLEEFDGKTWRISAERKAVNRQYKQLNNGFAANVSGPYLSYRVITEPTHQNWLFAIDLAVPSDFSTAQKIWPSHDYTLSSRIPITHNFQYRIKSYLDTPLNQTLFSIDNRINRQLPQKGNPKSQRWAMQLRQQYPDDGRFIQAVLDYFRHGQFVYTLKPPLMSEDPVDQFLFDEKRGFCSHYASAMAYVLRLGGIPARMVTGYQGGEMREQNYLSVYQYDAHAWVEAWHSDMGWQRYDPTAVVAPDRIEYGLRAALDGAEELIDSPFSLARFSGITWLNDLRLMLADLDFLWAKWVLGFDQQQQKDLIKSLIGKLTPQRLALFGLSIMGFIAALLLVFFWRALWGQKPDAMNRYYQQAEQELLKLKVKRLSFQGPQAFSDAVKNTVPLSVSIPFSRITQLLIQYQYQKPSVQIRDKLLEKMKSEWRTMKKAVRKIK